ncbi:hypothetical protein CUU66_03845 [Peribacillus deserti]|uniref:Uncharacterized protein n=1 Tax=Peribacillus deserti TaxID=673318 RepID=A0A2N5M9Z5_9BACI|nr:hypothetical protein CUU66_03845 [Peribacillus deserti]
MGGFYNTFTFIRTFLYIGQVEYIVKDPFIQGAKGKAKTTPFSPFRFLLLFKRTPVFFFQIILMVE